MKIQRQQLLLCLFLPTLQGLLTAQAESNASILEQQAKPNAYLL